MSKTKIEWADEVWNPVWGCLNDCPYCYARNIARRFGKTEDERNFLPCWKESNFNIKFAKSTKRVFVNSMSDVMFWKPEWWERVIGRIKQHPDIQFIFLTKEGCVAYDGNRFPENVVLGLTVLRGSYRHGNNLDRFWPAVKWLINIEPIMLSFNTAYAWDMIKEFDWIIIGAETGNRKHKVVPKLDWYECLLTQNQVPVFLKPSLDSITPQHLIRREFI